MDGAKQEDASPAFSLNENPAFDVEGEFDSLARSHTHDALSSPPRQAQDAGKTRHPCTPPWLASRYVHDHSNSCQEC